MKRIHLACLFLSLLAGRPAPAAVPPPPTRAPTESQLRRIAIVRDLWAEVQAWRELGAGAQAGAATASEIALALQDIRDRLGSIEIQTAPRMQPAAYEAIFTLRGDRYNGPAAYEIFLDGALTAFGTVSDDPAGPAAHETRVALVPGVSTISIRFANDAYGGAPDKDRNMYLTGFAIAGKPHLTLAGAVLESGVERQPGGTIKFSANGSATFRLR